MSKILVIGYDYYHYANAIVDTLKGLDHDVDFYSIEPRGFIYKLSRYGHKLTGNRPVINAIGNTIVRRNIAYKTFHYDNILNKTKDINYDIVFFLTTLYIPDDYIAKFKSVHKDARFIAYHWDSLGKHNNYLGNVKFFDKVLSFDSADCRKHGFQYLPLFASGAYDALEIKRPDIDVYSVGTVAVLDRYFSAQDYKKKFESMGLNCYLYLKVTPFTYLRLLAKGVRPKDVHFGTLDIEGMRAIVSRSRAVLDVPNHTQSGLTMRVIENACIGCKILTTNRNIVNEDFYNKELIHILGMDNDANIFNFVRTSARCTERPELKLGSWIKVVLS
jgi:hypothetical protein